MKLVGLRLEIHIHYRRLNESQEPSQTHIWSQTALMILRSSLARKLAYSYDVTDPLIF